MKSDISTSGDIKKLIDTFYDKVKVDSTIGHFFTEVVMVNWEKHLPVMYSFWENIVFHSGGYEGNPMELHQNLHHIQNLKMEHFQRWTQLFNQTVDELYDGINANYIKQRALSIATVMQIKIFS